MQAREDIAWWLDFLPQWSGSSKLLEPTWQPSLDMQLFTDASSLGYGAYWSGRWIQGDWLRAQTHYDIAWKELYAIVAACNVWGNAWAGRRILFHCDNESIVLTWKKGTSRSPSVMCLVHALYWVAAQFQFHVSTTHIKGSSNTIANALSRFQMDVFRRAAPLADPLPTPTPAKLMRL